MKEKTLFDLVSEITQKLNIPAILIGGFAVNYHGVVRQTQDVSNGRGELREGQVPF